MTNEKYFNSVRGRIEAVIVNNESRIYAPAEIYAGEALELQVIATEDMPDLSNAGMTKEKVDDLIPLACAYLHCDTLCDTTTPSLNPIRIEWKTKYEEALHLKDFLLNAGRFGFRKDTDMLKEITRITEGNNEEDDLKDLNDISVLYKKQPEPLRNINFDFNLLDLAAQYSSELSILRAKKSVGIFEEVDYSELRLKAYWLLKELVDEIRDCGKYIYWDNSEKRKRYTSDYIRAKKRRQKNSEEDSQV